MFDPKKIGEELLRWIIATLFLYLFGVIGFVLLFVYFFK